MNAPLQEGVAVGRTKFTYRQSKGRIWVQTEVGPFYLDRPAVVDGMNFIILGRADFFRSFVVTFDQRNQRMDLAALGQEIGFRPN